VATATPITADEYYALTVEGDCKQLVDGQIVVNERKAIHALLQMRLGAALHTWAQGARGRGLALMPTDVKMDEYNVYGYEEGGLAELWLVDDAAETVLVYRRSKPRARTFDVALEVGVGESLSSPGLPGFELPLDELFKR
jgi:hypothetical protein